MPRRRTITNPVAIGCLLLACLTYSSSVFADVRAWRGTVTIPTYAWESDVNPKFWAIETDGHGSIVYPYTMQDHLSRDKADRTYRALFLENEYLKVTCLPELGGRIHSVLDKTENREMFYLNRVIKPSMIAMRGAWVSGGIEWNAGPQNHTVSCVTPVDALLGKNSDGSAYLEISNLEQSQRTRWTVRLTLFSGRSILHERITLFNPTDALSPYYFWNCTAFVSRDGTRFIFPMSLGTDHEGSKFFHWPINEGKDLTWLKNYETWASIFAVDCEFDFFGAYDIDLDRGIVQTADHTRVGGKKAWTWGTWEYGLSSQRNLTDEDGPYIEVQSGPLPTQSDYGALWPRQSVSWEESWYPVHGLGDGFEFATQDVAIQTARPGDQLDVHVIATSEFAGASCTISNTQGQLLEKRMDLTPATPRTASLDRLPAEPVRIRIADADGKELALFTSPLAIPRVDPPPAVEDEDQSLPPSVEERFASARKADLATDRAAARHGYQSVIDIEANHAGARLGLAILDIESGQYAKARDSLAKIVKCDSDNGMSWYFLGVCHLRLGQMDDAVQCARSCAGLSETAAIGRDLEGRVLMRAKKYAQAVEAFEAATALNQNDPKSRGHLLLALYAAGREREAFARARSDVIDRPVDLVPRAVIALSDRLEMERFTQDVRAFAGDVDFELLSASLSFAEVGLLEEARRLLDAVCVESVAESERNPLTLYYLAWFASRCHDPSMARSYLSQARPLQRDFVFPSRTVALDVLNHAVNTEPSDARARQHLGNLLAHLGRVDEAVDQWKKAIEINPKLSIALRNLGLHARAKQKDLANAVRYYRMAIAARPADQTLYRDLAQALSEDNRRAEAIKVLTSMPVRGRRRSDAALVLVGLYVDEKQFTEAIDFLESAPHFVNWEGASVPWLLFNQAHVGRGKVRFDNAEYDAALKDFDAALTYPENLGVGRSNTHEHASAHYWRGNTLAALDRPKLARSAWQKGADEPEGSPSQNKHRKLCEDALSSGE